MARRSPYTARERVLVLLQKRTQKEAAALLGVSSRTVRRWKNEGVTPAPDRDHRLTLESNRERRAISIHNRRLAKGRQPAITQAVVVPVGMRRVLKEYKGGAWTGRYRESPWVNYDVSRFGQAELFALVRSFMGRFVVVQFLYETTMDDPAASGRIIHDKHGKPRKVRAGGVPQDMSAIESGDEVADLIAEYFPPSPRKLLWFAVHDRPKAKRRRG